MNDRTRRLYAMFSRVLIFMTGNINDFQAIPFVAATVSELETETAKIAALAADKVQHTAAAKDSTVSRGDARDNLHDALEDIADVWKTVITGNVEVANKFRMPRSEGDQNFIAVAKAFAAEAEANKQIFLDRGMPTDFIIDLQSKISTFEQSVTHSETSRSARVGTNAAFDEPLRKCKNLVAALEPAVKRTYRSNPQKMAEWLVASHVQRVADPEKADGNSEDENK